MKNIITGMRAKNQSMSIQKNSLVSKRKKQDTAAKQRQRLDLTGTNTKNEYFSIRFGSIVDETDLSKCWQYNIPQILPSQKQLYLSFEIFDSLITGYIGNDYPSTINLHLRNYSGFLDVNGQVTSKVIVLNLSGISSVLNQTGITQNTLIYKNQMPLLWYLGQLRTLQFEVTVDDDSTPINVPFLNSLLVQFKIIHQAF